MTRFLLWRTRWPPPRGGALARLTATAWTRFPPSSPGPIRSHLPKRTSMACVSQRDCNRIAKKLNTRPRKRYNYDTPEERFHVA